jgi:plastocyanin
MLASASETRLLGTLGTQTTQGDIAIVLGAASPTNAQFYLPTNLTVKAGTTVTWVNHDAAAHTVTSMNGAFDSGNMAVGAMYTFTFTQPGTYSYYCTYHTWMKGTIVVTS